MLLRKNVLGFQLIPLSTGNGVDIIGRIIKHYGESYRELGALRLVEGGGAKHSPPGEACQKVIKSARFDNF